MKMCHDQVFFATRSPVRPNPLAMTVVKVEKIDERLKRIYISGTEGFDKRQKLKEEYSEKKDGIWVKGARENNLKGIDVKIPYKKITAVVGVSGSGKSSLVKDTIYAECKRRMEYLSNEHHVLARPKMEYMSEAFQKKLLWGSEEEVTFSYDNKKNGRKGEITRQVEGAIPIIERLFNENDGVK